MDAMLFSSQLQTRNKECRVYRRRFFLYRTKDSYTKPGEQPFSNKHVTMERWMQVVLRNNQSRTPRRFFLGFS